jgi:ribosomal protein S2
MYYKLLIKRNKLIKYWILFGGNVVSKSNYFFYLLCEHFGCFVNIKKLTVVLRQIFLFFYIWLKQKKINKIIFIATRSLYTKIFYNKKYTKVKNLIKWKSGGFTNFKKLGLRVFNTHFKKLPTIIVFLRVLENIPILKEAKNKNLVTIGLTESHISANIIDYPIFINGSYFYTVCFFTKVLFYIISK